MLANPDSWLFERKDSGPTDRTDLDLIHSPTKGQVLELMFAGIDRSQNASPSNGWALPHPVNVAAMMMSIDRFKAPAILGLILASSTLFVGCAPKKAADATAPAPQTEAAAPAGGEQAHQPIEFTLKNGTNAPITEFYVSPPKDENWGESLMKAGQTLEPGESGKVTINDGLPDCQYDIKAHFGAAPDGSVGEGELVESNVHICDGTTYTYTR